MIDCGGAPGQRIAIVGVGLMGGSIGLALRAANPNIEILGVDRADVIEAAVNRGAIHQGFSQPADCIPSSDTVVIAVPVHAVCGAIRSIAPFVSAAATVTDIASVKSSIAAFGNELLGERFIAGHPMAGSEQTGVQNAREDLFNDAAWALTPITQDSVRLEHLEALLRSTGARPIRLNPSTHDRIAALVSHLPHLLSFAYNRCIEADPEAELAHRMGGGSYRDFTRVAASDPTLWRDVFLENKDWLLAALQAHREAISSLEAAVLTADPDTVMQSILTAAATHKSA